jgi:Ser/Thr protein kinase RdoA (MazF antagonist)
MARLVGLPNKTQVSLVKTQNHVFQLESGSDIFFLKTYTKDWYGDEILSTAYHTRHEVTAWSIMSKHSLAVPEVVYWSDSTNNPLERPFVMTRALPGKSLTQRLRDADALKFAALLKSVGAYLARMHQITFHYPGYLETTEGPSNPPSPAAWQHRCWSARQRQQDTLAQIASEVALLPPSLVEHIRQLVSGMAKQMELAYQPPQFTHGDCHAHQFFLSPEGEEWRLTGVLDMEVSSAGDSGEDLLKLCIELAQLFPHQTNWWTSLFTGYGVTPDFDLFCLRLLGVAPIEFGTGGYWINGQTRTAVLNHFLFATDWNSLFAPV